MARIKNDVDRRGVYIGYQDSTGVWRPTQASTRHAIYAAMGSASENDRAESIPPVRLVKAGTTSPLSGPGELILEDGTRLALTKRLPSDLPVGYHDLHLLRQDHSQRIIVSPPNGCFLPDHLDAWGWSVQLYALRSARSWGIGDLADLRRFVRWSSANTSARLLLVNPLCAATPGLPQQASPYFPSSRLFRNPLYLDVEAMPGTGNDSAPIHRLAVEARALNDRRLIDRDAVYKIKMKAFERLWKSFRPTPPFDKYCKQQGEPLELFAAFCALAEHFGPDWRVWPARFRRPDSTAVKWFAAESAVRIRFHQWLQWQLDDQLGRAGKKCRLITDLPVGVDPGGADAWHWQDVLASGVHVGAPPDQFNTLGQDWNLQPFVPHRLRGMGYVPFIQGLRAAFRHAGGLRMDHIMGLFRLFWIPNGMTPARGAYVAYPAEEMLAVMAVESHRAKALVIGEDLGTVQPGVRRCLARHQVLGYAVMWFEKNRPSRYRAKSLASITTHDLPTIAGLWHGKDVQIQRQLGLCPPEEDYKRISHRLCRLTGLGPTSNPHEVIHLLHRLLAEATSRLRVTTLDDALGVVERPNMPGTITEYPNWSLALPHPLEEICRHPLVLNVVRAMETRKRKR